MKYAILLDSAFVKKKLGSKETPATSLEFIKLVDSIKDSEFLKDHALFRCYLYDAPPLTKKLQIPLQGGEMNLSASELSKNNIAIFNTLKETPFFSLRMGELKFRGWKLGKYVKDNHTRELTISAEDLAPDIQQKGVDMRIGLDIASLSLKRQVDIIVLVTGDSDFVPAMKFARREGVLVYTVPLGHTVTPSVIEHSDVIIKINPDALKRVSGD